MFIYMGFPVSLFYAFHHPAIYERFVQQPNEQEAALTAERDEGNYREYQELVHHFNRRAIEKRFGATAAASPNSLGAEKAERSTL